MLKTVPDQQHPPHAQKQFHDDDECALEELAAACPQEQLHMKSTCVIDSKCLLNETVMGKVGRALKKGDIDYRQVGPQFSAVVRLVALEDMTGDRIEFRGETCRTRKEAEKSAAQEALIKLAMMKHTDLRPGSGDDSEAVQTECTSTPQSWKGALRKVIIQINGKQVTEEWQPLAKTLQELSLETCGQPVVCFVENTSAHLSARLGSFPGSLLSPLAIAFQELGQPESNDVIAVNTCDDDGTLPKIPTFCCRECRMVLESEADVQSHELMERHWCSDCQVEVSGNYNWEQHVAGKRHRQRLSRRGQSQAS